MHKAAPAPAQHTLGVPGYVPGETEPWLEHPHIGEYLQFIDQRGIETIVRTNGIGLRHKIGNLTSLQDIRYCISLHAATPDTWTSIHLGKSETDYWDIVDYVRALPQETLRKFSLSNALCRLNYSEVSEMVTPILDEEHTEYGWFNINSLGNFPEKIDPKIIECIKLYHNL